MLRIRTKILSALESDVISAIETTERYDEQWLNNMAAYVLDRGLYRADRVCGLAQASA